MTSGQRAIRILIVDGDDEAAADLSGRLVDLGYQTAGSVRSGREALEGFSRFEPDLVVIDADLPGSPDSAQTAHALRRLRNVPVLFTRPLRQNQVGALEILASPVACLRKPYCDREIEAVLELVLSQDRSFLAEVVENSGALVFVKALDGRYLFVNRKWQEVCGLTPEQTLGRTDEEIFPQVSSAPFRVNDLRAQEEGRVLEFEEILVTPEGPRHFLSLKFPHRDGAGQVAGSCGLATEITDLKKAEFGLRQALAESQLFRSILDESPAYAFVKDRNRRYLYANRQTLELLGLTPERLVGKSDVEVLGPGAEDRIRPDDERVLAGERIVGERRIPLPDGQEGTFWDIKSPLYSEEQGPHPWAILGISSDITDLKRAEAERARLQEQLEQVARMDSIGRLAGGVAHDFNNMLGVILGQTELAAEELPAGHPMHELLAEIRHAAERSAALTRQLLAFARQQKTVPRLLDLNRAVEAMLGILGRLLGEGVHLVWRPGPDLWPVRIDPSQLDQILANLCVNSRDAMRGRGTLILETRNLPAGPQGEAEARAGDLVLLQVCDDGCGMDAETAARIFEPFFTTKGPCEGTGLGLSTVYGVVRQAGGEIQLESRPGLGTTFRILLPRHEEAPAPESSSALGSGLPRGRERILLVEDEPAVLHMTRTMLQRLGYAVLAAPCPSEALRLAREEGERIDLLLTDVVMPGMNGLELAARVRKLCPKASHLFMSGHARELVAMNGTCEEASRLVSKPFSMRELGEALRAALDARIKG